MLPERAFAIDLPLESAPWHCPQIRTVIFSATIFPFAAASMVFGWVDIDYSGLFARLGTTRLLPHYPPKCVLSNSPSKGLSAGCLSMENGQCLAEIARKLWRTRCISCAPSPHSYLSFSSKLRLAQTYVKLSI